MKLGTTMKPSNFKMAMWVLMLTGILSACVTINIYFPAASAQKVADEIIDDVWQLKNGEKTTEGAGESADKNTSEDTQEAVSQDAEKRVEPATEATEY